jgi:hypothetical protein
VAAAAVGPPQWAALVVWQGLMGQAALAAQECKTSSGQHHTATRDTIVAAAVVVRAAAPAHTAALAAKAGAAKAAMGHLETRRAELLTRAGAAGAKAQKQLGLAVRVGAAL